LLIIKYLFLEDNPIMSLSSKFKITKNILLILMLTTPFIITASALEITAIGKFEFFSNKSEVKIEQPDGLSGITYLGEQKYWAVSDRHAAAHELSIHLDLNTGEILKANSRPMLVLTNADGGLNKETWGADREGIIYDNKNNRVCISNERTGSDVYSPSISCHSIKSGKTTKVITSDTDIKLSVFANIRKNAGFESLSFDSQSNTIWTANEDALTVDGNEPTHLTGSVVRLLQFNELLQPIKQLAYEVDSIEQLISADSSLVDREFSGLVELLSLPTGELLALERALVGDNFNQAAIRIRIYKVDYANATDISQAPWLSGLLNSTIVYKKVNKKLLFEMFNPADFNTSNFEGITLGPKLINGDYALILIADNDSGLKQALYSLRLKL